MKIRSKLAWTFIILLVAGVTAVSSYSILFIRDYLLQQRLIELRKDTQRLAVVISHLNDDSGFHSNLAEIAETVGYQVAFYDSTGELIYSHPKKIMPPIFLNHGLQIRAKTREGLPLIHESDGGEKLTSTVYLSQSKNRVAFIRLSQFEENFFHPIQKIRWIIYWGMFISVALIIIVSLWMARYLTKPITRIKDAARAIAEGDVERKMDLNRSDEFGDLADSLNQMADKLRRDTEQIKAYADKQRRFFADITHEIRNPLHTISASLDMMQMKDLPEDKQEKYCRNARNQVDRLDRLIKDLKALQHYDSDEYFIEQQKFDLSEIGEHMGEWYGEKAEEKGLSLNVDTHPCKVVGDPGKIEQVIDNLVSNAVKYTHEGSIHFTYRAEDGAVRIEVADTGPGISDDHIDHLFDRFYRTDKARSRENGGTGLGLAVVQSILNAHETDIHAESELGRGSTFWFKLSAG